MSNPRELKRTLYIQMHSDCSYSSSILLSLKTVLSRTFDLGLHSILNFRIHAHKQCLSLTLLNCGTLVSPIAGKKLILAVQVMVGVTHNASMFVIEGSFMVSLGDDLHLAKRFWL